jgi:hypothetical protein
MKVGSVALAVTVSNAGLAPMQIFAMSLTGTKASGEICMVDLAALNVHVGEKFPVIVPGGTATAWLFEIEQLEYGHEAIRGEQGLLWRLWNGMLIHVYLANGEVISKVVKHPDDRATRDLALGVRRVGQPDEPPDGYHAQEGTEVSEETKDPQRE